MACVHMGPALASPVFDDAIGERGIASIPATPLDVTEADGHYVLTAEGPRSRQEGPHRRVQGRRALDPRREALTTRGDEGEGAAARADAEADPGRSTR